MEKIKINDKLFYRFVEFTNKLLGVDLTHEAFKLISLDSFVAQTKSEKKVKDFSDAFRYLINNISSDVSITLIEKAYFILTSKRISLKNINRILNEYYQRVDENAHQKATDIFLEISKIKISRKIEFAFLLTNYVLIKRNYYPIIIYPTEKQVFKDALKEAKSNPRIFYLMVIQIEHYIRTTHNYKEKPKEFKKTKEEIMVILNNEKEKIRKTYGIKEMYLYGSYAKNTNIETSDLDILVVFNETTMNYYKQEAKAKIKEYLSKLLNEKIDIMEFSHALSSLEIHEMNNIITII